MFPKTFKMYVHKSYIHTHIYIYIYIYIEREREREITCKDLLAKNTKQTTISHYTNYLL